MKRIIAVAISALSLASCTTAQLNAIQQGTTNFTASVQSINTAIASVSTTVAQNCSQLQATAASLAALISAFSTNTKAIGGLSAANAALVTWCSAPPTDIP